MDVGKDVSRGRRTRAIAKLSDTVQGMMANWTEENFGMFGETMELIRENAPVQWAKLYLEAVKMGIVKQSEININISRQKDRDDLQALVRSRISIGDKGNYVPFEEVKPAGNTAGTVVEVEREPMPLPLREEIDRT